MQPGQGTSLSESGSGPGRQEAQYSGAQWVARFPASRSIGDLSLPFRSKVEAFVGAMRNAGATVVVNGTLRDRRRAYLMHWCWRIVNENIDPQEVPLSNEVAVRWAHLDQSGNYARTPSMTAARDMVHAFGLGRLGVAPSLASRHLIGCAIDMSIGWTGTLPIAGHDGKVVSIASAPSSGMNPQLQRVGEGYGVIKYNRGGRDEPHWSDTGA